MLNLYVKAQNMLQTLKDEAGQDSVEYAIMIAIVALGVITSVGTISTYISNKFASYAASL